MLGKTVRDQSPKGIVRLDQDADHTTICFDLGAERTFLELVVNGADSKELEVLAVESWREEPDERCSRMGRLDVVFSDWAERGGRLLPGRVFRTALTEQLARDQGREPTGTVSELEFAESLQAGHARASGFAARLSGLRDPLHCMVKVCVGECRDWHFRSVETHGEHSTRARLECSGYSICRISIGRAHATCPRCGRCGLTVRVSKSSR